MANFDTTATFTKLNDGSWGLRVKGVAHHGDYVVVTKKNGESTMKQIKTVLWADGINADRVSLCTIAA